MTVLVGTTLTTFAMDDPDTWGSWIRNAEAIRAAVPDVRVEFFAAIQTDARGLDPLFDPLLDRLTDLDLDPVDTATGQWWDYRLDDGRTSVTTANRLRHLTMGQNLVTDRAVSDPAITHLLFMAADCQAPDNVLAELLPMDHDYVAPFIPTYGLRGDPVPWAVRDGDGWRTVPCERAMPSAACVLLGRRVYNRLRWRYDPVAGLSDDPALMRDAAELLGVDPLVRMDVVARHFPESIGPVETRGHSMEVVR